MSSDSVSSQKNGNEEKKYKEYIVKVVRSNSLGVFRL